MADKIIHKKSSVASKVPLASDLEVGELALNLEDAKIFTKKADGTVITIGQPDQTIPAGYGDSDVDTHLNVSGATSNQVLQWDGSDYAWATVSAPDQSVNVDADPQFGDVDVNKIHRTDGGATGELWFENEVGRVKIKGYTYTAIMFPQRTGMEDHFAFIADSAGNTTLYYGMDPDYSARLMTTNTGVTITGAISMGDWKIEQDGSGNLLFSNLGTGVAKLDSSGHWTTADDQTAFGTI